jgi:arylsulfatase A-like enzyme/HEAT repeat protein
VWLLVLGLGLCALAGLALAAVALALRALVVRIVPARWLGPEVAGPLAAALLAAPMLVIDAFALFEGPRASRLPGHHGISALIALGGVMAVGLAARVYVRIVHDAPSRRRMVIGALLLLTGSALGAYAANRVVLPRLYPWFHVSLSLVFLAVLVLLARLALALRRAPAGASRRGRRRDVRWVAVATLAAIVLLALSLPRLAASQSFRFAVHEKTLISSVLLRGLRAAPLPLGSKRPLRSPADRETADRAATALPPGPRLPEADVFLITVDALRADHVGAYGYGRPTTPNIDAFARRAVRFERAYAQAPHTSFSVASMLTGKYYPTIARLAPGDPHDTIAQVLRQYGWKTAAFYPPAVFFVDADKLKAYQENNFRFEYVKVEFLDAHLRLQQIAAYLDQEKPDRTFVWLHLFEPHEPYDARPGHHFGTADIDRYDSEIAYADKAVGQLLEDLAERRPNAIVILAADHGEAFDEHKSRYHGSTLYEEQIRVPLLIAVPGVPARVVSNPVEMIDLAPTILSLLDIPVPARMRGTDLGPWLMTPGAPEDRLPPAFAELEDKRMVAWRKEKIICAMNWGYCAYHDLARDPGEEVNLADARPDRVNALRRMLDEWLDDHSRWEPQLLRGQANPEGQAVPKAIERGRLADLGAVSDLAAMLQSVEPLPVRREAARLLVMLPRREETKGRIEAALATVGDDAELADWVAVAASRFGSESARKHVHEILARPDPGDREKDLRIQAALALAFVGDNVGVPVMARTLDRCDNIALCRRIIIQLGAIRDRRAVPKLIAHLPEVMNRREMVAALGDIGDPIAVDALLERLAHDEYVPVREEAAIALAKIGGHQALVGLHRSLPREREGTVLAAVRAAIEKLEQARPAGAAASAASKSLESKTGPRRDKARSRRSAKDL